MTTRDIGHTKIRGLRCYKNMIAVVQAGGTYGEAARFIQEQGEMKKIKTRSVEQAVRRFFEDHPELGVTKDPAVARAIDLKHGGDPPGYIVKLRDAAEDHIDSLSEMERLYELQKDRVFEYREKEKEGQSVGADLRAEIKTALKMLGDIAQLQMDLEIVEKAPTRIEGRFAEWRGLDIGAQLKELLEDKPELAVKIVGLLESPEKMKDFLRGDLIED